MDAEYNLLVVDDEPVIAESIQRLLSTGLGIPVEVFCAYRGKRALEVLESNRIDLMVSDINMPDMNGLDLLEQVNRRWPACKTIFLTGYPEFTYAYQAFQRHAVGYILKTDEDQVLLDSVQAALDQLKAQLRAASYAPLERSREDLAHIQRLFDAALGAQKSALLADVLPLMGFTQPCERLVFLLSMVPGLQADTDDALLEAAALRHLPGLVRLAPVSHPLPEATLWLGQFEERPSQVYLNGMLEPLQVAFSAASDKNVSFIVGYPGADGEKMPRPQRGKLRLTARQRETGKRLLPMMLWLICFMPGMPCDYYGDEAGMEGATDPYNRAPFPWGHEDAQLQQFFAETLKRYRASAALTGGALEIEAPDDDALCVRRTLDGKSETLLLNRTSHARRVTAFGKSASVAAKGWAISN